MWIKLRWQWTSSNSLQASAAFTYVQYILAKRREEGERLGGERASDVKVSFVRALLERWYCSRSHLRTSRKQGLLRLVSIIAARTLADCNNALHFSFSFFLFFLICMKVWLNAVFAKIPEVSVSFSFSLSQFVTSSALVGRESGLADFSRAWAAKFLPLVSFSCESVAFRGPRPRCDVVTFSPSPRSCARLFSFGNRAAWDDARERALGDERYWS